MRGRREFLEFRLKMGLLTRGVVGSWQVILGKNKRLCTQGNSQEGMWEQTTTQMSLEGCC